MAKSMTARGDMSISQFLNSIENPDRRRDAKALWKLMREEIDLKPSMWGDTIVGFGSYRYKYASGRKGESFRIGFSPRTQGMSLYLMSDFEGEDKLMAKVGKHKMGRCCMTFKRMSDLDIDVLRELVAKSAKGEICSEVVA